MARYKHIDTSPRFLAVDLKRQLLLGTFEHALDHLLEHEIDLSALHARFKNDETGATAYPPAMLLKVILYAYAQGIVGSRGIERACREHVTGARFVRVRWSALLDHDRHVNRRTGIEVPYLRQLHF